MHINGVARPSYLYSVTLRNMNFANLSFTKCTDDPSYRDPLNMTDALGCEGPRHEPFNSTPTGVNPITSGPPHVQCTPMGVHRTCGEPDEIKKNTPPTKRYRCHSCPGVFKPGHGHRAACRVRHVYASRAVQFHPHGGQFDFVWLPARAMHPHGGCISTCGA